ncbi:sigma 54-interacting transcriptional regulator [Thauera sp.]|jgi:DNA-binding NtrC family response regulator|uniref:sigma 54-interacting transcriptional regulator n=1 Tax=Thauera sp. TaxID=1905334 RepID=UPI002A364DCB|nr:sigma 54-interacting transcriptional regulator [Thauera sp.]MDX9887269.1 sigma 54-interacting transcriptional regulator [Thauera sp.]
MSEQRLIEHFNLRSRLRFNIEKGQIWLDENRMLLLHARAMGALRKELFDSLGPRRAQGLLLRMGFMSGQQDAELASKLYGAGDNYDVFRIGPELHAFEGLVKAEITQADIDWEAGSFFGEVVWEGSWEAESHMQQFGGGHDAACWSLVGYASGYTTRFFKRLIVFRETQCVCKGDPKCVIVGKPAEAWGEDPYLQHFKPENLDWKLQEMEAELVELRGQLRERHEPGRLVGTSAGFRAAFDLLSKAASSPINVLLLGETGVGKEVFARWLHENSDRREQPFIAVNCAAIPHDLIESELFGVQKGAYTGAQQSRPGRFERADGGTLFLDELGELSLAAQVKLLRVLQTGELERLGDERTRKVNVRLVAATNVNLQQAIAEGRFRSDLYYRLATYPVTIPPLRDRKADIPLLVASMLEKYAPRYHKTLDGLTDRAMQALMSYEWPGNIRELENLVERGVLLAPSGGQIEVDHLFAGGAPGLVDGGAEVDREGVVGDAVKADQDRLCEMLLGEGLDLEAHEARLLNLAVKRSGGNLTHAARLLGITRRQLAYRLKQFEGDGGLRGR